MAPGTIRARFPDGDRDWPARSLRSGRAVPICRDGWRFTYVEGRWRAFATIARATA